ncbi:MAG: hypothetical protein P8J27_12840 [Mariniblastus sp.]|nr:hypothetical protein [Mariniblastus sp.]
MSDLRHDPINDQWIAIARNRINRPMEFVPVEQIRRQIICPFCKGNEEETPAAIATYGVRGLLNDKAELADWIVRVIPNKYPSYSSSESEPEVRHPLETGIHCSNQMNGVQELVIPSPRHVSSLSELTAVEISKTVQACQDRVAALRLMAGIEHAMLFMNCRHAAGASLGHIHLQLIGSPIASRHLQERVDRDAANRKEHGCSLIESLMNWEIKQGERVIALTENFCVVCPFASRFAFQARIIPRQSDLSFLDLNSAMCRELGNHCKSLVERLESQVDHPAYNLLLQLDPFQAPHSNWYFELMPRLTRSAGFEIGTDIWVNPVSPEVAARRLRE